MASCIVLTLSSSLLQVDVKITLGLFGVLIVIVAVGGSIGLLSYAKVMASLIILEVVPFLVLAVSVDNLFILVHSYEVSSCILLWTCTSDMTVSSHQLL